MLCIFNYHFIFVCIAGSENCSDIVERDLGARSRDRERSSASREDCRQRVYGDRDYRERSSGDGDYFGDRDYAGVRDYYRERDRDFGEIVFLEREGEMLAHFQASQRCALAHWQRPRLLSQAPGIISKNPFRKNCNYVWLMTILTSHSITLEFKSSLVLVQLSLLSLTSPFYRRRPSTSK